MSLDLAIARERFEITGGFRISRGAKSHAEVLVATLSDGRNVGRGECVPYARYGETLESVEAEIEAQRPSLAAGMDRATLQGAMPPGAARNALDCALWDLEAKRAGRRAWELAGLPACATTPTAYTLSIDDPMAMRVKAAANAWRPLLKVKLGGDFDADLARIACVREGAPAARIVVDANEGWSADDYARLAPEMVRLGVSMVEQPLPAGDDGALAEVTRSLPVCADESCHDRSSLSGLVGKYDMVNIKLDKTGGLTEALALRDAAQGAGFRIMVGCMLGTSLGMAPALLIAQGAEVVDLDGPLLLARDRAPGLVYDDQGAHPPAPELWG
jgi:L-alanine-DL-glutamate epimerase-like enolase superfamily enzyme